MDDQTRDTALKLAEAVIAADRQYSRAVRRLAQKVLDSTPAPDDEAEARKARMDPARQLGHRMATELGGSVGTSTINPRTGHREFLAGEGGGSAADIMAAAGEEMARSILNPSARQEFSGESGGDTAGRMAAGVGEEIGRSALPPSSRAFAFKTGAEGIESLSGEGGGGKADTADQERPWHPPSEN